VIRSYQDWQRRPFLHLLLDLQRQELGQPFVPERLATLKAWADTGTSGTMVAQAARARPEQLLEIVPIEAYELVPAGQAIDPYVLVFDGGQWIVRTARRLGVGEARWCRKAAGGRFLPMVHHQPRIVFRRLARPTSRLLLTHYAQKALVVVFFRAVLDCDLLLRRTERG
jgi:hypothetical protein